MSNVRTMFQPEARENAGWDACPPGPGLPWQVVTQEANPRVVAEISMEWEPDVQEDFCDMREALLGILDMLAAKKEGRIVTPEQIRANLKRARDALAKAGAL